MVHYFSCDVIPITEFAYAWRLTDDRWDELPDAVLKRIVPLSLMRGEQIVELSSIFRNSGPFCVNASRYHVTHSVTLAETDATSAQRVQGWLTTLPVHPRESVYVSWGNRAAIVTEWSTFVGVWDSLWYPFDVLDVFDDSLSWGVLFGPEQFAVMVEQGAVNPDSDTYSEDAGYGLVRCDY